MTTEPAAPPVPLPHPTGPLAPYRVLDFSDEKGQLCARLLGELGADVIKVEPPRDGDPSRKNGPFFKGEKGENTSLYWWAMNAGKRSVTCQLKLEAGRELMHRLAATADILIETNPPGKAAALGLDYRTLSAVNPALVVVSITNFGQTGPFRDLHATDIVASAMGGHMFLNGDPERGPVRTTAPQAYAQVNFQAAAGAAIALYGRSVTGGLGQHVDVSMQEAMTNAMDHAQTTWDIRRINTVGPGLNRQRAGDDRGRYLYETASGWVAVPAGGGLYGKTSEAFLDWLGAEAGVLASADWRARLAAGPVVDAEGMATVEAVLGAFVRTRDRDTLVAEAQARGAGWAPVYSPREIVDCEQLRDRDYWVRVRHDDIGESFIYPGAPFRMTATPWAQRGRAPLLGEHTEQVYGELLGIDATELRRLRLKMVV